MTETAPPLPPPAKVGAVHEKDVQWPELRARSQAENLGSAFAGQILSLFRCPKCRQPLKKQDQALICAAGHSVPITNGIPEFTHFIEAAIDEKAQQAAWHDDEERNEAFAEIVLRPYNYNQVHLDSWTHHLFRFKKKLKQRLNGELVNSRILNCGCGGGFEAQFLAEQGAQVVGFDISQLRAEASAARFSLRKLPGLFYRGEAALLPFDDCTFDYVLYHDSLHHVPIEEIPKAIREAARVARKGVVLLEAHDSPLRMLLESMGRSASLEEAGNYVFRFRKSLMQFWALQNHMDLVEYSVMFTKKEHRAHFYGIPGVGWLLYRLIRIIGFFLAPLGNEAIILFRKSPPA